MATKGATVLTHPSISANHTTTKELPAFHVVVGGGSSVKDAEVVMQGETIASP